MGNTKLGATTKGYSPVGASGQLGLPADFTGAAYCHPAL